MLQSLAGKLSRLNDVARIGLTVADELRLLIDYHNCRVFLRRGDDLLPIAFRGNLMAAEPGASVELMPTRVGRGVTGRVAETGEPLLIHDAGSYEFAEQIEGTADIAESLLAVPLTFGSRVTGVIVISKLGLDQFDEDDLRVLEVLAGHASVALENARLYEAQRREAESATALLEFARDVAEADGIAEVAERVVQGSAKILSSPSASLWLQNAASGDLERLAAHPHAGRDTIVREVVVPAEHLGPWITRTEPYFIGAADYAAIASPPENTDGRFAIAPFTVDGRWGVIAAAIPPKTLFADRELELLGGLAQQTKLALQSAESYETLERTFVSTVEALANALEANDEYTSTHARWITDLALKVGVELGLDAKALKGLELGALFHDIGKIGIPSAILLKPWSPDSRGARRRRDAPTARRAHPRADRPARGCGAHRSQLPRALRRHRLPRPPRGRSHPHRVAHHLRLRRLPRDDDRSPVPPGAEHRGGHRPPARRGGPAVRSARRRDLPARPRELRSRLRRPRPRPCAGRAAPTSRTRPPSRSRARTLRVRAAGRRQGSRARSRART